MSLNQLDAVEYIKNRVTIAESGCWEWSLKVRRNGYARATFMRQSWYAHRLSFVAFKGGIPEGMDVCHRCDNRKCVNPSHLFSGTRTDNMQDAVSKGRVATGEKLPQSKITDSERLQILDLIHYGFLYREIAIWYGVRRTSIGLIARKFGVLRYEKRCK